MGAEGSAEHPSTENGIINAATETYSGLLKRSTFLGPQFEKPEPCARPLFADDQEQVATSNTGEEPVAYSLTGEESTAVNDLFNLAVDKVTEIQQNDATPELARMGAIFKIYPNVMFIPRKDVSECRITGYEFSGTGNSVTVYVPHRYRNFIELLMITSSLQEEIELDQGSIKSISSKGVQVFGYLTMLVRSLDNESTTTEEDDSESTRQNWPGQYL